MALADSFVQAYHFRLLYMSTQLMYPIMGAMRHSYGKPWEVWRRFDLGKKEERFDLVGTFESEPSGQLLSNCFKNKPADTDSDKPWWAKL